MRINDQHKIQIQEHNNLLTTLILLTQLIHISQQVTNHLINFNLVHKLLSQQFEYAQTFFSNLLLVFQFIVLD